jgi:DDB1- and CUL4-associated factor 13
MTERLTVFLQDRSIRIWSRDKGQSRDMYHTKRMQRVFRACWTMDSKYLLSGSDDVCFSQLLLLALSY